MKENQRDYCGYCCDSIENFVLSNQIYQIDKTTPHENLVFRACKYMELIIFFPLYKVFNNTCNRGCVLQRRWVGCH